MAPSLYEILGVTPSATRDEIRTAYKAMALKTHPDRAKPEQKEEAEQAFRKVNAAYEVLYNETTRFEYDTTGRVPPNSGLEQPQSSQGHSGASSSHSHSHRGANSGRPPQFGAAFPGFFSTGPSTSTGFDPFESFFGSAFSTAPGSRSTRANNPWGSPFENFPSAFGGAGSRDPFESMFSDPFFGGDPFAELRERQQQRTRDVHDLFDQLRNTQMRHSSVPQPQEARSSSNDNGYQQENRSSRHRGRSQTQPMFQTSFSSSTSFSSGGNGGFVSESYSESYVNGQRQTVHSRRDADGTEHVEYKYADGSSRYLRNGAEQPSGTLPPPLSSRRATHRDHYLPSAESTSSRNRRP